MTHKEIIAMAREAGMGNALGSVDGLDELARFAALVAAKEREACQKIADDCADADMHASMAANAIRARGQKDCSSATLSASSSS